MRNAINARTKLRLAIGVTMIVVGFTLWWYSRPNLEREARRGVECVLNGNGDCVYDLTPDDERLAYGMPKSAYSVILREFVVPNIKSVGIQTQVESVTGNVNAMHEVITSRGRRTAIGAQATPMPEGIRAPVLMTSALNSAAMNEGEDGEGGIGKLRNHLKFYKKNYARLRELGMRGIYRNPDEGLMTWEEWIAYLERRLEEAKAHESNEGR